MHAATHCNTQQHTAQTHVLHNASQSHYKNKARIKTLQYTATHCNRTKHPLLRQPKATKPRAAVSLWRHPVALLTLLVEVGLDWEGDVCCVVCCSVEEKDGVGGGWGGN